VLVVAAAAVAAVLAVVAAAGRRPLPAKEGPRARLLVVVV